MSDAIQTTQPSQPGQPGQPAQPSQPSLADRCRTLAALLQETQPLWDQRPFRQLPAPWEASHPEVSAWLRGLSTANIDAFEADPLRVAPLPAMLHDLHSRVLAATTVAAWPEPAPPWRAPAGGVMRRVKGRKQAQILAFQRAMSPLLERALEQRPGRATPSRLVDLCGGKGHLSRALGRSCGCPVWVLEQQPALVEAAERLGAAAGVPVTGVAVDVLSAAPATLPGLSQDAALLALHACGHLTDAALDAVLAHDVPWLALVPCCHHRTPPGGWQARSEVVRATGLRLNVNALRLAIADEGPATPRARARRRKEMCWRIGADALLRAWSHDPTVAPLGPIRRAIYNQPYDAFCRAVLAPREVTLPASWDADAHLRWATERTRQVRAIALVRGLLRRAVETLCVLDRGQALVEAGYDVEVATFCPREVTPRNLLLLARRLGE